MSRSHFDSQMASARADAVKRTDAWSPEAREAAAEARKQHSSASGWHFNQAMNSRERSGGGSQTARQVSTAHETASKLHREAARNVGNEHRGREAEGKLHEHVASSGIPHAPGYKPR